MSNRFWPLLIVGSLSSVTSAFALTARLGHETGSADAARQIGAETFDLENVSGPFAFTAYARRDALAPDRNLTNAIALASAGFELEGHRFQFGLGSHYRHEKLSARQNTPGNFYPAFGFLWSHAVFRSEVFGSQYATKASGSFLLELPVALELNSEFEYLHSQPYRWSAQVFAFVSKYGGLILGYEPLSERARLGAWLAPTQSIRLSALARFAPAGEAFLEFSLQYSLDIAPETARHEAEPYIPKRPRVQKRKLPQKVPEFSTLIKWGLTPVEALRFTRERDACALSESARASLARKNWGCRDAA
ncbi:hypothetical protein [Turneriella parva]|uniref:Inverse autotransporter beta-domain domain-containing protein n=1 Tax=Turneriella parva (strain ATCC BAA-1111 / DSM 21527 / NCTC 11395 / H) TaxID=869212 RepID=I4B4C1_TURPD|nr:hypothetical protein [Turneriella parva]AFM12128.1 hypothetical protein Turpa_1480 [Turneriella parva DSM 21527]